MLHDVIIIGGSFAGLATATYLARGRRSVAIVDSGLPRNRFAAHSHGFLGQDGSSPAEILATARAQVDAYPSVQFVSGEAVAAEGSADRFTVRLADGRAIEGRRIVLAFGISDVLPTIPGLAERWGTSVLHCPYCHGYEFADRPLGVLHMSEKSLHQVKLIAEWGPTTYFLDGAQMPEDAEMAALAARGIAIEAEPVGGLKGEGKDLAGIELADGRLVPVEALYIGPPTRLNSPIAEQLGCALEEGPFGPLVRTQATATSVEGVFAAGDITRGAHNVTWAASDGVLAGMSVHRSLVF